jgi:uncharacterized protein YjiS (DUF1127 family)
MDMTMQNATETLTKLIEAVRAAVDEREADSAVRFASGYVRALSDFGIISDERDREARKSLIEVRNAWMPRLVASH